MCAHYGKPVDPDSRDNIGGPVTIPGVAEFIGQSFKGVAALPSITEYCMYTVSSSTASHIGVLLYIHSILPSSSYIAVTVSLYIL